MDRFRKYDKPVWMTEFCAWEGTLTPQSQMKYMCDMINYMECDPDVARYAWFIPCGDGSVDIPKGKHNIRFRVKQGRLCVNWLQIGR